MLLKHNLYSGAKHFPLFSQRPFHFHCSIAAPLFCRDKQYTIITITAFTTKTLSCCISSEAVLNIFHFASKWDVQKLIRWRKKMRRQLSLKIT